VRTMTFLVPACLALAGCMTAAQHYRQLGATQDRALTVGLVQKEIKVGLSQADVAGTLGSPNIVTRDSQNRETWIYDKIATEASFSQGSGDVSAAVNGNGVFPGTNPASVSGSVAGSYSKQAGAASVTQRTLTVVIKFDRGSAVESLAYQSTTF
jgi:outer membrane protein assembly factor BamE (lipoprotein component of BamABCDE complex)